MSLFVFIAVAAGLIAFIATPFTLIVAQRIGFVAMPGPRKTHTTPTPMLGGVAIWAAFVVSLLVFGQGSEYRELVAIIISGTLITVVGFVDDRLGLGPLAKLLGQGLAACILVFGGVQAQMFSSGWLNLAITLIWVIGICNAINFLDNMDGLAAGVSAVAAGSFLLLAALNGQELVSSLAAALLGACLGFLVYNFQPAISFMGDTGSLLLGFMLAVLGIKLSFPGTNPIATWMAPILVLGLPIFDTTLVTLSRFRRGVPIAQGGADHTSHRLARLGLSHRRVVVALYTVSASLGIFTVIVTQSGPVLANILFFGLVAVGLFVLWLLEEVYRLPAASHLRPDMRVTFIGGGQAMVPLLEGATVISRSLTVLIAPGAEGQMPVTRLHACLALLAENREAAGRVIAGSAGFAADGRLVDQVALAEAALRLRGRILLTLDPDGEVRPEAIAALQHTDLIVVGGDLRENVLPILKCEAIGHALRRSKRARVLAHPDPAAALVEIERAAGPGLITHIITEATVETGTVLWHAAADLNQSNQIADALNQIWMRRMRVRGAPQPISGSTYG
jgi:UDP-GlcNAc:undecaprenyl-phosphate GlcNAc-1-phosphate transferase